MANFDKAIEAIIQNAIERGAFDNLPGKGKPLNLHTNPMAAEDWQLAYSMLEQEGYAPPWIEERSLIESELEIARKNLKRTWDWRQQQLAVGKENSPEVVREWRQAETRFLEKIEKLNKRIKSYNMQIPADVFFRPLIKPGAEIEEIDKI